MWDLSKGIKQCRKDMWQNLREKIIIIFYRNRETSTVPHDSHRGPPELPLWMCLRLWTSPPAPMASLSGHTNKQMKSKVISCEGVITALWSMWWLLRDSCILDFEKNSLFTHTQNYWLFWRWILHRGDGSKATNLHSRQQVTDRLMFVSEIQLVVHHIFFAWLGD